MYFSKIIIQSIRLLSLKSLSTLFILLFSITLHAETNKEKGLAIAIQADKNNQGFADSISSLKMIIRNKHGQESVREMRSKILEQVEDGDKSLFIFDLPRDVKGTVFLSHAHKTGSDDQWLFLPALKRVKRISTSNQSGAFMGSEFSYEDMSSPELEKYDYEFIEDETLDGRDHYKVKRIPLDKDSGYAYQTVWVGKKNHLIWKMDFYTKHNKHLKTLVLSDYQHHSDKHWRVGKMFMTNHLTGNTTELQFTNWQFDNKFSANEFTKNSMKNLR